VRRRLEALRADAIAIVAGDHVEAFFLNAVRRSPSTSGPNARGRSAAIDTDSRFTSLWPRSIVEQGVERGFDLFYTQHAPLDYAFYVPLHFTCPSRRYRSFRST